jgi:hypothetical protein
MQQPCIGTLHRSRRPVLRSSTAEGGRKEAESVALRNAPPRHLGGYVAVLVPSKRGAGLLVFRQFGGHAIELLLHVR